MIKETNAKVIHARAFTVGIRGHKRLQLRANKVFVCLKDPKVHYQGCHASGKSQGN